MTFRRSTLAVLLATVLAGCGGDDKPPPGGTALKAYAAAWQRGDDAAAAKLTDDPARAQKALTVSREGMDGGRVTVTLGKVAEPEDDDAPQRSTVTARVTWRAPTLPEPFSYDVQLTAVPDGTAKGDDAPWRVRWSERNVHPRLNSRTRLGTALEANERGRVLDRRGTPIVTQRSVVDIAVEVDRAEDRAATAARLGDVLGDDIDARRLARTLRRAAAGRFVPVVTLRAADFARAEEALTAIPGVSVNRTTAPLAPTPAFARPTLGSVGPATAEQVEKSGGKVKPGELIGQGGVQERFQDDLAPVATRSVVVRRRASGAEDETLKTWRGRNGRDVTLTLDRGVQEAAERALRGVDGNAALVAVQPSSGDVLAVANRPADTGYDRALLGRYPPGSTFKVVSTYALLGAGLSPQQTVSCPPTTTVDGRAFKNFEGGSSGPVPFAQDFAQSCNTAFVLLADRLRPSDLPAAAKAFGLGGEEFNAGLPVATADVPAPEGATAMAAAMIGQDKIVASPLNMAGVAATVAEGRWRSPRLLPEAKSVAGERLSSGRLRTLRALMRQVVTSGTGTALASLPGDVRGKSGTAEYGSGDPPPTHAWFIATRGDLALAVLVEGGRSGGSVAAPVARRFLDLVP